MRHQKQTRPFLMRVWLNHRQVHKNSWQIEQAGKPACDKNDVKSFNPEHGRSVAAGERQKKPQHRAGVISLLAVTRQGPAQGGKAGGTKVPEKNYSSGFNETVKYRYFVKFSREFSFFMRT